MVLRGGQLSEVDLPALVIHGSRDTLIEPSGGGDRCLISGARFVEIDGMGHDYPPAVWREWVNLWSAFAKESVAR